MSICGKKRLKGAINSKNIWVEWFRGDLLSALLMWGMLSVLITRCGRQPHEKRIESPPAKIAELTSPTGPTSEEGGRSGQCGLGYSGTILAYETPTTTQL